MTQQDVPTDFVTRLTGLTMNPEPIRQPVTESSMSTRPNEATTIASTSSASPSATTSTDAPTATTAGLATVPISINTTSSDEKRPSISGALEGEGAAGASGKASHQPDVTLRALVTTREAGVIIGKEGKNVAAVREATGVRAGVSKVVPGSNERILTVGGPLDAVAKVSRYLVMWHYTRAALARTRKLLLMKRQIGLFSYG